MKNEGKMGRLLIYCIAFTMFLSIVAILPSASAVSTTTVSVSQPIQVTSDSHYVRGQSICYDGSNYWLFYGRSASCTDPYSSGNPDLHDYEVYYKKASSVAGLATATAAKVPGTHNSNVYLGETDSAYYVSASTDAVRVYAAVDEGSTATLYQWYYTLDTLTWHESTIATGLPTGSAHFAVTNFSGNLWVAYKSGGNWVSMYHSGSSWSSTYTIKSSTSGTGKFFCDGSDLYFVRAQGGDQRQHDHFR